MITKYKDIKNIDIKSKILEEYSLIKDKNEDSIVLFQIGSFFETYFEDAKILSDITGILLTEKHFKELGSILQAGIPINSLQLYIKKLLQNNYKVCVCQQLKNKDDNFYREITRIYTKGTILENEFLDSTENNFILAIKKNQNLYEISYADVSTGEFYKTINTKTDIQNEIKKIEPTEILALDSEYDFLKDIIEKYNTTIVDKQSYQELPTEEIIKKYYNYTQKNYVAELNKLKEYKINSFMKLDDITRKSLELTRTKRTMKKKGSLLYFLNYTKTPMGVRLLKKFLNEPLLNIDEIMLRQNTIQELIANQNYIKEYSEIFSTFCDLSRITAKISNSTITPKSLLGLSKNENNLKSLQLLNDEVKSQHLKIEKNLLLAIINLVEEINNSIDENCTEEMKSGNIIKEGYNSELDYMKEKLIQIKKEINQYELDIKKFSNIEKLKINYIKSIGFYIEVPNWENLKIPIGFLKIQSLQNTTRYTTQKLKELEDRFISLEYKKNEFEYELFCKIRNKISNFTKNIRKFAEQIAKIDVYVSLAKCAIINNLTKPLFNTEKIEIENGYHPSLVNSGIEIITNNTTLINNSIIILTGANMSGKSTYLKYNALICLLAQIGSYVPAEKSNLTIIDKIFFHQDAEDDISNNMSNFMIEMNNFKYIIDNSTSSSMILLDEPAKSTNNKEGYCIARSFLEYLIDNTKAKTIVATHNTELTQLEKIYPNYIVNYMIEMDKSKNYRKIKTGITKNSNAIEIAKLANLPKEIIQKAELYYQS